MSHLDYFNLSIPARDRLAMMRRDFAAHPVKNPHCPESFKPRSWRELRRYTLANYAAAFGVADRGSDTGPSGNSEPVLYAFHPETLPVRSLRDVQQILKLINHTGWYCDDDDASQLCVGVVASLPHGKFLAGYRLTDSGEVALFANRLFDDERDAAHFADSVAEQYAERERDYLAQYREACALEDAIGENIEALRRARAEHSAAIADRIVAAGSIVSGAGRAAARAADRAAGARRRAAELAQRIRENRDARRAIIV